MVPQWMTTGSQVNHFTVKQLWVTLIMCVKDVWVWVCGGGEGWVFTTFSISVLTSVFLWSTWDAIIMHENTIQIQFDCLKSRRSWFFFSPESLNRAKTHFMVKVREKTHSCCCCFVVAVILEPQAQMRCSSMTPDSAAHSCGDTLRCKVTHRLTTKINKNTAQGEKGSRLQSFWRKTLQLFSSRRQNKEKEGEEKNNSPPSRNKVWTQSLL